MPARGLRRHRPRISGRLEVQCVNFASRSCTAPKVPGVAPPQHDSHGVAELLVLNVPEPLCSSSISGNVPEWRYLGPHLRLPESSGFWPDCRLQFGFPLPLSSRPPSCPACAFQSGCRKRELSTFRLQLLFALHRLLKSATRRISWPGKPAAPRADRPIV